MFSRRISLPLALVSALLALPALAQERTGSLVFEVRDTDDKPVSGISITVEGESLQGTQVRETDEQGRARFLQLPPGDYHADIGGAGFIGVRNDVAVALGDAKVVPITLTRGEIAESVQVLAQKPIEPTETSTRQTYNSTVLKNTHLGSANRSYQSVMQHSPGVSGGSNPSVHGATLGENTYLIDGVNTTDPVTGTFGLNTNFDTIQQVEFLTGGFQAEYGQATGGIANIITKSGGNEFHGSFDGRYSTENFDLEGAHYNNDSPRKFERFDLTLGGPIKKDKVWFFVGYSDIVSQSKPGNAFQTRSFEGESHLAKLTFQPTQDHRIAVQYTADPATILNSDASALVAPEADTTQEQGAKFSSVSYWGRLSDHWNITAQAGRYRSKLNAFPPNDNGLPSIIDDFTGLLFQNANDAQFSNRDRDQVAATLEWVSSGERWHDVKFGFDHQDTEFSFERQQPGGEEIHINTNPAFGLGNTPLYSFVLIPSGRNQDYGKMLALFAQDTLHLSRRWTIDFGLRWDRARFERDDKTEIMDLAMIQPRLGAAFNLKGEGINVFRWSLARYMHPNILTIPLAVNARADATEYYDADCDGDGVLGPLVLCGVFGGPSGSVVEKGTDPTYVDEFTFGYRHLIQDNMTFGVTLIGRETQDIIEDMEFPVGSGHYAIRNIDELSRKYRGVEFEYAWNSRRWHVFANYNYSRAKGNIEYTQGLGSDWDFPDLTTNRYGHLSYDRPHALKVFGWVDLPKKFKIGYDMIWRSGNPYNRIVAITPYGDRFVEPRGSRRLPNFREITGEVGKTFDIKKVKLTTLGTIHNVLNEQEVITKSARSGNPLAWQQPRRYELGLRVEF